MPRTEAWQAGNERQVNYLNPTK